MRIKHGDIAIPETDPFANCKLNRKPYAGALTSIVRAFPSGLVLSINNEWGAGKTTFLKMWRQELNNAAFRTLHFNAWEHDFETEPLVAILSELKTLEPPAKELTSLYKKAAVLTQHIAPVLLKALAEKYIDIKVVTKSVEELTKAAAEILKEEVDEYSKKKKGLADFRSELEKLVAAKSDGKPLVFIIDELDRCRPDYAVEVLEKVKHFFSVPGITFVLAIDKEQLINAIRGYYGSEQINGTEYLKRFIDIEYNLPTPQYADFSQYLFEYYELGKFFNQQKRMYEPELSQDYHIFTKFAPLLFSLTKATLRQQEKIFARAKIIIHSFSNDGYVFPDVLLFLIYLKEFHPGIYGLLVERQLPAQNILDRLDASIPSMLDREAAEAFMRIFSRIVVYYANSLKELDNFEELVVTDPETNRTEVVVSTKLARFDNPYFINAVTTMSRGHSSRISLKLFLGKVDLLVEVTE